MNDRGGRTEHSTDTRARAHEEDEVVDGRVITPHGEKSVHCTAHGGLFLSRKLMR